MQKATAADDDSYVFLENLRQYLTKFDPTKPHYLGFRFRPYLKNGYNSGGVYVLSKAAVKLFIENSYLNETLCPYLEFEDVAMAKCLESIDIHPIDTRDEKGRQRFTPYDVDQMFAGALSEELSRIWFMDKPNEVSYFGSLKSKIS
uniref:Glycoprotein-N-acetylgalactosamine 3-beta-galactosyltransferase 1 n=1 Tax=Panagrolaimus davidi TaxID=227884 RepID=A0A914PHW4_9BILA